MRVGQAVSVKHNHHHIYKTAQMTVSETDNKCYQEYAKVSTFMILLKKLHNSLTIIELNQRIGRCGY